MKRPTWLRKALWFIPILLIVLVVAALLSARVYLSSERTPRLVADRLQSILGGRVQVHEANIGLFGDSTVQSIQAYEDGQHDKPWLRIEGVKAEMSALSLMRGKSPDQLQLEGAHIGLRFDKDGHMLTQLPKPQEGAAAQIPRLHIEQGELTLNQEGRPPMVIRGINADIVSGEKGMELTGTISDPFWGNWQARGDSNPANGSSTITLDATEVAVTMEKLKAIAFVPPSVWQQVHAEGKTPARMRLDLRTSGEKPTVNYRVELSPHDTHVQVPSIDLDATGASGKVVVVDQLVQLEDVRGQLAQGTISTNGDLNFREETTRLAFKVGVQNVALRELPRRWKVPPRIDGRLTGKADLVVTINKGKVLTEGSGKGEIAQAIWHGSWGRTIQIKKPIRLTLHSKNGRFHFGDPKPEVVGNARPEVRSRAEEAIPAEEIAAAGEEGDVEDEGAPNLLENAPLRVVRLLDRGIHWSVDELSHLLDATTHGLGKLKPPSKPGEAPTYLDVDLSLDDVDLAQLVQKLSLRLPYTIAGRLTFQVHASIPINTPNDTKAYRLRGTAKVPRLKVAGLEMTEVDARVRYADGVLDLEDLHGSIPELKDPKRSGKFEGSARVEVIPKGDLRAKLKLDGVPLDVALSLLPAAKDTAAGVVSGSLQASAPVAKLSDPASWRGTATLTSPAIEVYGLSLRTASADLNVERGRANLTAFKADMEGMPLTGEGELRLDGAYPFKGKLHLDRTDLTALNRLTPAFRLPIEISGRAQLDGSLSGTLNPLKFDTAGEVQARDLVAEGLKVDKLSFRWSKEKSGLKLDSIKAELYGGDVTGSAEAPLTASAPGKANLRIRNLNVQALTKSLPSFPIRLEGKVSGTVAGKLIASAAKKPRAWTTDIELAAPRLRVQGIPAEKLTGTIDSHDGKTSYRLEGESLGGKFNLKGDLPARGKEKAKEKAAQPEGQGRLEVRGAQLSRLWDVYDITGALAHLRGSMSISLPYRHVGKHDLPVGNGTFRIVNVRWDDELLSDRLQGEVRLTADELRIIDVTGDVGQGLFRGRFAFGLGSRTTGWFNLTLQQIEAGRLLVPLPQLATHINGPVDVSLRGRIGPEWSGSGEAALTRGQVFGLDITEWRFPMQFTFSPTQGSGEVTIRDSHATIAQGRAKSDATLNWGNGLRLTGQVRFYQVDLRTLLRHTAALSSYASGRVSGRIDLGGSEMRSVNDLTAVVRARLEQGQALQLPVLRQITPYLRPGISSATFQSGELKGRLTGGVFRVQRLTLVGNLLQLLVEGTVNLAGNLNLEVTAESGALRLDSNRASRLGSSLALLSALPRAVLYEASALLANRVVHLRVTGTINSPSVHIEPVLLLTEEAIRFFLGRAANLSVPSTP